MTIDPDDASVGKQPLAMLSSYRKAGGNVYFGQFLTHASGGELAVGDTIEVLERREPEISLV